MKRMEWVEVSVPLVSRLWFQDVLREVITHCRVQL